MSRKLPPAQLTKYGSGRENMVLSTGMSDGPSDSHLLWDGVRVMVRLLKAARDLPGAPRLTFVNHSRVAKKRAQALWYTRGTS